MMGQQYLHNLLTLRKYPAQREYPDTGFLSESSRTINVPAQEMGTVIEKIIM